MATQSLTPYRSNSLDPSRPASPLLSFYRQANRLFEDVFREFDEAGEVLGGILSPNIDVTASEQDIRITAELPGVRENNVEVTVDGDVLTIRAEKRSEQTERKDTRHISERAYGTFQRSLRLPQVVDPEQVRAHFSDGVLTVILPRNDQGQERRRITIESGPPPERHAGTQEVRH